MASVVDKSPPSRISVWDAMAKAAGMPLAVFLGGMVGSVPASPPRREAAAVAKFAA
jgi:L-alanine-DL-glutamate epimerase-like enolase superfamily enzyme